MSTPESRAPSTARFALAVVPAAVLPFFGSLIYFVFFAGQSWARWTYVATKVFTLVWPIVATRWVLEQPLPRVDWRDPKHRKALKLGLVVGGGISLVILGLWETPVGTYVNAYADQIRAKVVQLGVLDQYVAFALFLSLAHSGLEEYYWRWFLYGNLRTRLRVPVAAVLGSAAFASHHLIIVREYFSVPWALFFAFSVLAGGVIWCWMYERQKTLTGAWLSHAILDLAILWVGYQMLF